MKKIIQIKNHLIRVWPILMALGPLTATARAEFTVGDDLPVFSLKTPDGQVVELRREGETVHLRMGEQETKPAALVIHLLQPDCLQCQAQLEALKGVARKFRDREVIVLGISHRGTEHDARELVKDLKPTFPIAMGVDSEIARRFAAGDTLGIADRKGKIQFAQVGYGDGDRKVWEQALEELLAGKPLTKTSIDRKRLAVGDPMEPIRLPSLESGKLMSLDRVDGRLVFRDENGKETKPKAAVGFFSRYWAFSREEMVHLQKFHEKYADKGLFVFVISMHPELAEARKLTRELKVTYPVLNGHKSDLGKKYAYGWPAYILDAVGVIRYTQVGFEQGDEAKYEKVITELLAKTAPWVSPLGTRSYT